MPPSKPIIQTSAERALAELAEVQRETLVAEARIENAERALNSALDERVRVRNLLRERVVAARVAGASFPQIAAVLDVSVQRAHALAKAPEVRRR